MMICRLRVDGEVECDLTFKSGVNVIKADNSKGKTSVLKIIKLAITGKDSLDKKLKDKVKEIFLEFQLDQKVYTSYVCRGRKKGSRAAWAIYEMSIDEVVPGESEPIISNNTEIVKFFMNQFGLPKIAHKKAKREKLEYEKKYIGFGDYFRAFYQDQKKGYIEIMSNYPSTRISVMGVMMGLHEVGLLGKFDIAIADKETETKILRKRLQIFENYMKLRAEKYGSTEDFDAKLREQRMMLSKKKMDLQELDRQRETQLKSNISPILENIDSIENVIGKLENRRDDFRMIISNLKNDESQLPKLTPISMTTISLNSI